MSDAQAGTTAATNPENSEKAGQAGAADVSGLNAQQQKEYMTLKQKAEDYNKVVREKEELAARLAQTERFVAGQGNGQATDPYAGDIAALREQAAYDPAARATLLSLEMSARASQDILLTETLDADPRVTPAKRPKVSALIRNSNYQMSVDNALSLVTDPETKSYQEQLAEAQKEIERLKSAKPHGSSPASTPPASASADDEGAKSEMKWSEYHAVLDKGGQRALDLMQQVGANKVKLIRD